MTKYLIQTAILFAAWSSLVMVSAIIAVVTGWDIDVVLWKVTGAALAFSLYQHLEDRKIPS